MSSTGAVRVDLAIREERIIGYYGTVVSSTIPYYPHITRSPLPVPTGHHRRLARLRDRCLHVGGRTRRDLELADASASPAALTRVERWTADVTTLVEQMEDIHPDLFHGVPEATFDRAAGELIDAIPDLDDDEMLVGVMHLVAMISTHGGDGHMGIWPPDNPDAVRRFPVRLWEFPDGVYVTAARQPNADLEGARVLKVDGIPIDAVFERLDPVVPRDTPSNLRAARMVFLTSAEVLTGLGIADDVDTMVLDVRTADGERRTVTIDAVDAETYADWVGGWELLLPERPGLDFLRDAQAPFRLDYLACGADARRPLPGRAGTQRRGRRLRSGRRCAITPSIASCWICGTTGEARPAGSANSCGSWWTNAFRSSCWSDG